MNNPNQKELTKISLLKERANRFRTSEKSEGNQSFEAIAFRQGNNTYSIPLSMLSEIRLVNGITQIPLTSPSIIGVTNVRGKIVAVYKLFNEVNYNNEQGFILVGYGEAKNAAFFANDIIGTQKFTNEDIKEKPISLKDKNFITGISDGGMIHIDIKSFVENNNLYLA